MELPTNVAKLCAALRGGTYKKGVKLLHYFEHGEDRFCATGVACDLWLKENNLEWQDITALVEDSAAMRSAMRATSDAGVFQVPTQGFSGAHHYQWEPPEVTKWLDPQFGTDLTSMLVSRNDKGDSFEEIADATEAFYSVR